VKLFLQRWMINTLAVLVASYVPGIDYLKWTDLFVASLLLGILNAILRPMLMLLSLPLLFLTLGFFFFIINAALLGLVGWAMRPHFTVDGFWAAFFGGIVISLVSSVLGMLTGTTQSKITVQRGTARKPESKDDDGPVIDV
jgi:putative membrane protein